MFLNINQVSPPQDHICTGHRCCCFRLVSSHCVWCLPSLVRGGTAAQRPQLGGRCRGSPPEKNESEKSLWKTDGWFYLPRRRSSNKKGWRRLFSTYFMTVVISLLVACVTHRWRPGVGVIWRWGTVLFGAGGGVLFMFTLAPVICRKHKPTLKHYVSQLSVHKQQEGLLLGN